MKFVATTENLMLNHVLHEVPILVPEAPPLTVENVLMPGNFTLLSTVNSKANLKF